jgi:ABC-type lipoprotein export system ATPase subunit
VQKQHIGFVFQSYHLLDNLTVYENIEMPLSYRDVKKAEREGMVADILDRFNIVGKKDLFPTSCRAAAALVAISGAVSAKPTLILADEPTGNLHSDQGKGDHGAVRLNEGAHHRAGDALEGGAPLQAHVINLKDGWIVDAN